MHDDQLIVTPDMVADLVAEQFPEWAELPIVQAIGLVWYDETSKPAMSSLGRRSLSEIVSDPTAA
jgi:hypothetical protein